MLIKISEKIRSKRIEYQLLLQLYFYFVDSFLKKEI